jgi:hypothetical protein
MDRIQDIAHALEDLLKGGPLEHFQERRRALNGGNAWRDGLFSEQKGVEEPRQGYAFHKGGRSELQFNIGFEDDNHFRFGVAFGIQAGQSLPDPVVVLGSRIKRFNAVLASRHDFPSLQMWHYENGKMHGPYPPRPIPDALVREGVFVFLGERVKVGNAGVTPAMLQQAKSTLESLWPLFEVVEGKDRPLPAPPGDKRVARLCWNAHNWTRPSGRPGKTSSKNAFEGVNGYGHEEWLFDWENVHEGWQYGFIQGVKRAHWGEVFDLLLYSLNTPNHTRYWVGTIEGVEVLDGTAALAASRRMERVGKLGRMRGQIEAFGLEPGTLVAHEGHNVINVRFRPAQATVFDEPVEFDHDELPMGRYVLQEPKTSQQVLYRPGPGRDKVVKRGVHTSVSQRTTYANVIDIDPVHAKWQVRLEQTVPEDLPGAKADKERVIEDHRIDLVIERDGFCAFVEIKTDPSPRKVIRAALAQLLEYAYWPDDQRCHVLLIAGALPAGSDDEDFLSMLRASFGIPVYYIHIDDGRLAGLAQRWPTWVAAHPPGGRTGAADSKSGGR